MDIRISKESEVPLRLQLGRQIAFLISTGKLKPREALPSVRGLATRLKIHYNTVSQAYQDLVDYHLLERRRGSRLIVPFPGKQTVQAGVPDLDDVINAAIQVAQQHGYTPQQLRQRVRERLLDQPPDHLLVVQSDPGLGQLIREELKENLDLPVEVCSPSELSSNPGLAIGALVVCPHGIIHEIASLVPKNRPAIPITNSTADAHVKLIHRLREPSVIAVVSVSERFLQTARGLLAPALGRRHTLQEFFLPMEKPSSLKAADVVFCDSIARRQVKARNLVHYQLTSPESLTRLARAMKPGPHRARAAVRKSHDCSATGGGN